MSSTPSAAGPFPFVRLLSTRCTPYLARLPLTPNHITLLSIAFGLAAGAAILAGSRGGAVLGAALLVVSYVLDNCDGEIARLKRMSSRFGARLDDFGDWLVHTLLFAAMGLAASRARLDTVWLWFGLAAGAGGTLNYLASMLPALSGGGAATPPAEQGPSDAAAMPATPLEWTAFVFRELMRADFCFIVLLLALVDSLWWLLPAAAIGAQVYWMLRMVRAASRFHV